MTTDAVVVPPVAEAKPTSAKGRTGRAKAPRTRRRTLRQFGWALGGLTYFLGVALGTMLAGGIIFQRLVPNRHVDIFAALHNHIVLGVLLGLSVLWLIPPYPWAAHQPTESREPADPAGETEVGGTPNATDLSQYRAGPRLPGPRLQEGGG